MVQRARASAAAPGAGGAKKAKQPSSPKGSHATAAPAAATSVSFVVCAAGVLLLALLATWVYRTQGEASGSGEGGNAAKRASGNGKAAKAKAASGSQGKATDTAQAEKAPKKKKKLSAAQVQQEFLRLVKLSNGEDYNATHELALQLMPHMPNERVGTWAQAWPRMAEKMKANRVPGVENADVFFFDDFVTAAEATEMRGVLDAMYDNWQLQEPICFDHRWDFEPPQIQPDWYWKPRIVEAGVLKASDFEEKALDGGMKTDCVKPRSSTRRNIDALRSFLNVSRSVLVARGYSKVTDVVERRIHEATGAPAEKAFFTQYLHYTSGENYGAHTDCTLTKMGSSNADDRYITLLLYLSDPEGGETSFPILGKKFQPKRGDLVVWRNVYDGGQCNSHTFHVALPVHKGHKYVYQKWYNFHDKDHSSEEFTTPRNNIGCDRNGACREYLHAHQLPKRVQLP